MPLGALSKCHSFYLQPKKLKRMSSPIHSMVLYSLLLFEKVEKISFRNSNLWIPKRVHQEEGRLYDDDSLNLSFMKYSLNYILECRHFDCVSFFYCLPAKLVQFCRKLYDVFAIIPRTVVKWFHCSFDCVLFFIPFSLSSFTDDWWGMLVAVYKMDFLQIKSNYRFLYKKDKLFLNSFNKLKRNIIS